MDLNQRECVDVADPVAAVDIDRRGMYFLQHLGNHTAEPGQGGLVHGNARAAPVVARDALCSCQRRSGNWTRHGATYLRCCVESAAC
ncbi:MAG: hypothetical protein QOG57_2775 [Pseudonocardiales bacterium]|nr:hypothetical protein [Pseudonocardiales bacterium]